MVVLVMTSLPLPAAEFVVAPGGNDTNAGSKTLPFATFQRAQREVRAVRQVRPAEGVTVVFRPGVYSLERTVEFTPEDSGASTERPVRYAAEPAGEVVISGGRRLTGWEPDPKRAGVWRTKVDGAQVGGDPAFRFEQLWVNGQRAVRARGPNEWQFGLLESVLEESGAAGAPVTHVFTTRPKWLSCLQGLDETALRDVQVVVYHKWDTTREWLESASPAEGRFVTR